jgi:hypothetical protein
MPVYMQMDTHDLTAVSSCGPTAVHMPANAATEGLDCEDGYTMNNTLNNTTNYTMNTITFPLRRGTISVVENLMLDTYHAETSPWPVQPVNDWVCGEERHHVPYHLSM